MLALTAVLPPCAPWTQCACSPLFCSEHCAPVSLVLLQQMHHLFTEPRAHLNFMMLYARHISLLSCYHCNIAQPAFLRSTWSRMRGLLPVQDRIALATKPSSLLTACGQQARDSRASGHNQHAASKHGRCVQRNAPFGGAAAAISLMLLWPPDAMPTTWTWYTGKKALRNLCTHKTLAMRMYCSNSKSGQARLSCTSACLANMARGPSLQLKAMTKYNCQTIAAKRLQGALQACTAPAA